MQAWQKQVGDTQALTSDKPKAKDVTFDFERKPDQWQPAWIIEKYFKKP